MSTPRFIEGSIPRHLISYIVPLVLGNFFQLTYHAVDSIIVGRFIGQEALAAVGTTGPIINLIILGISGICIGASVLMSEFFGAHQLPMLKKEMATTSTFGLFFSLGIALLIILLARPLLLALNVPKEILGMACLYLRLNCLGIPFTFFYNSLSAAMKSIGDSKTPLRFLIFASVLNGTLDLIFIGGLGFGITCSAITTVIAEGTSAILCFFYIERKIPTLQVPWKELRIDRGLLKKTLQYGGVAALQQSCQPLGKLLIQGAINPLGVPVIAALNALNRIDDFAFVPEQNISHGMMVFIAQNRGASKRKRMLGGLQYGLGMEFVYWLLLCPLIFFFRESIMGFFVDEKDQTVIQLGSNYLQWMAFFYLFPAFTNGMQGFFRGMGNLGITLVGTILQISIRVVFVFLMTSSLGLNAVAFASCLGWTAMLILEFTYYFRQYRRLLISE